MKLDKSCRKEIVEDIVNKIIKSLPPEFTNCFSCDEELTSLKIHAIKKDNKILAKFCDKCTKIYQKDLNYFVEQWIKSHDIIAQRTTAF